MAAVDELAMEKQQNREELSAVSSGLSRNSGFSDIERENHFAASRCLLHVYICRLAYFSLS